MNTLITKPNFSDTDGFYASLIKSHEGLTDEQSEDLNARIILLLANHIGDKNILEEALKKAKFEK